MPCLVGCGSFVALVAWARAWHLAWQSKTLAPNRLLKLPPVLLRQFAQHPSLHQRLAEKNHSACLAKAGAMCGIPLSVHSLVTGLAVSLHWNNRLAASARLNSLHSLLLKHLVILCKHCLHSAFLWAVGCPVAWFPADVAVPRESATLILLWATGATLALETRHFLAILLRFLPVSTLALALAFHVWLVPHLLL